MNLRFFALPLFSGEAHLLLHPGELAQLRGFEVGCGGSAARQHNLIVELGLLLDRGELVVSLGGSCCQLFVQPDPEIVLPVAANPAAAASKFPASLLTLLVAPQLSAGQLLDDVFDGSLLRFPALQSLSHLAVEV